MKVVLFAQTTNNNNTLFFDFLSLPGHSLFWGGVGVHAVVN